MTAGPVPATPTTLYRFYDAHDRLLYVGISERGPERWRAHRKDKPWWTEVVRSTTEHYGTRAAALEAERAAIIAEQPLHNFVHNRGQQTATKSEPARPPTAFWRSYTCMWCARAIGDGDGYVWIDHPHERNRWVVTHRQCDPQVDRTGYWIAVDRIRTWDQFHDWVAHLCTKTWFDEVQFVEALLDGRAPWTYPAVSA